MVRASIGVAAILGLATAAGAVDLFSASFEAAQGYTTGPLIDEGFRTTANPGQQGWYGETWYVEAMTTSNAEVSTDYAHSGTQSLRLGNETYEISPPTSNVYKLFLHDFAEQSTGVLNAELWYYLENVDTGSAADTNNLWMVLNDRDDAFVLNGLNTSYGSTSSYLSPDRIGVAEGASGSVPLDFTDIAAAGAWRGIKFEMNLDPRLYNLDVKFDGDLVWTNLKDNAPWFNSIPDTLETIAVYQISGGAFSNPNTGTYVDDIRISVDLGGDFDGDGDSDADDVDLMLANLTGANVYNEDYDLDGDFDADQDDLIKYIRDIMNTEFGDWNLDGAVDLADFNLWLGESPPTGPAVVLSPEPASLALLGLGGLALLGRRRVRQRPRR